MEVDLLASGSKGNACIVKDGTTCILIDCGTTKKYLFSALEKVGISLDEIDALLITHDHSDHVSQIKHFSSLPVYSPVSLPDIDSFEVRELKSFVIETLKITPIALSHDALHTTGYIFESGEEKLVYITDTGYVPQKYFPILKGADMYIMESNHDVDLLMHTRRPQYVKARIYSDEGHLNNEDCADVLRQLVTKRTKTIFLAHISHEGNTRELALHTTVKALKSSSEIRNGLVVCAAGQFEILKKGESDEESDCGTVSYRFGMEHMVDGLFATDDRFSDI